MLKFLYSMRANLCILFLGLLALTAVPCAVGQTDFSLQVSPPNPANVDLDVDSSAIITLGSLNGFNSPVSLSCAITPVEAANGPTCAVSPASSTPPSSPSLTFATTSLTPPVEYTIAVTGVSGALTHTAPPIHITVLNAAGLYSITVDTTISPSSVPAGSGATAILDITSTDGYTGMVTPGCSSITPAVEPSPICSFNPATVTITDGQVATTTLTISTTGPTTTTSANAHRRAFYSLLIPLPFLTIAGFGGSGKRYRKLLSFFCLLMIAAGLVTLPACSASSSVNNGSVTPKNTYSFTITAYDANGVSASNTDVTVSLTVN